MKQTAAVTEIEGAARTLDQPRSHASAVAMGPGDELALRFSAAAFPPLKARWTRDYLLKADGRTRDRIRQTGAVGGREASQHLMHFAELPGRKVLLLAG